MPSAPSHRPKMKVRLARLCHRTLIGAVLGAAVAGCVAIARVSMPAVDAGSAVVLRDGVLELPALKLCVRPQNTVESLVFVGPLPFPGGGLTEHRRSEPFHVHLQFEPISGRFVDVPSDTLRLNPARVVLELDGTSYRPTRVLVPTRAIVRALDRGYYKGLAEGMQPGFEWHCPDFPNVARQQQSVAVGAGFVAVNVASACLILEFPVAPPSPNNHFTITVDGLEWSGAPVAVPPIRFEPASRSYYPRRQN
jgi:hypothetical protein